MAVRWALTPHNFTWHSVNDRDEYANSVGKPFKSNRPVECITSMEVSKYVSVRLQIRNTGSCNVRWNTRGGDLQGLKERAEGGTNEARVLLTSIKFTNSTQYI